MASAGHENQLADQQHGSNFPGDYRAQRDLHIGSRINNFYFNPQITSNESWRVRRDASDAITSQLTLGDELVVEQNVRQAILASLTFDGVRDRREAVHRAHQKTLPSVLERDPERTVKWDNFVVWVESQEPKSPIYWIHGKPGSGKSTLMRFLADNKNELPEMLQRWSGGKKVVQAHHFFWNPGNEMQKSIEGLLRMLLYQLLEQEPTLVAKIVPPEFIVIANASSYLKHDWSKYELRALLRKAVEHLAENNYLFMFVDGLDEVAGGDMSQEELVLLLQELSSSGSVKICLSSRSWIHFEAAFRQTPQLKLEEHNRRGIHEYVQDELTSTEDFQQVLVNEWQLAENIIADIVERSEGVFLWVYLVIRDVKRAAIRGQNITSILQLLRKIPDDLDQYFETLMQRIHSEDLPKASALFQVLLEKPLTQGGHKLFDLRFLTEGSADFALKEDFCVGKLDIPLTKEVRSQLQSTYKQINYWGWGMVEARAILLRRPESPQPDCHDDTLPYNYTNQFHLSESHKSSSSGNSATKLPMTALENSSFRHPNLNPFALHVDFIHRSFAEYLRLPDTQDFLRKYTRGRWDSRLYLGLTSCSNVLAFLRASIPLLTTQWIEDANGYRKWPPPLAEYLDESLKFLASLDAGKHPLMSSKFLEQLENAVNRSSTCKMWERLSRGDPILGAIPKEQTSFLALMTYYNAENYVKIKLTSNIAKEKQGRPLIDYAVVKNIRRYEWESLGPKLSFIEWLLDHGSDVHESYDGYTVWERFLHITLHDSHTWEDHLAWASFLDHALLMIRRGARQYLLYPEGSLFLNMHTGLWKTWDINDLDSKFYKYQQIYGDTQETFIETTERAGSYIAATDYIQYCVNEADGFRMIYYENDVFEGLETLQAQLYDRGDFPFPDDPRYKVHCRRQERIRKKELLHRSCAEDILQDTQDGLFDDPSEQSLHVHADYHRQLELEESDRTISARNTKAIGVDATEDERAMFAGLAALLNLSRLCKLL